MAFAQRLSLCVLAGVTAASAVGAQVDRPWVGAVFFYWYTWDRQADWGDWQGGIYYTPTGGYYDSRAYADNLRSLRHAADWGMTHFFMDYWSPDWKSDAGEPRDLILVRAAEELRRLGYHLWMSYYQDGENFAMNDFGLNITERRDVYNWLKNYAASKAWPTLDGSPFQMVYARNGSPEITGDDAGFREYLGRRYGSLEALNRAWGRAYRSFDDVEFDLVNPGPSRADGVDYQYSLWEKNWKAMNDLVRQEFGYPGIRVSFDVGYAPFRGFSYSDFARVFGGPHSYAGIFGQPQDQDAERYIQAAVAKRYGTIFFDHLKNYYCDWNTGGRIPGLEYPPDPFHFDRFWVGNLMRCCTGVLHMSWNEWWEGSNLEPPLELGKPFCEKNLFYSTLMQQAFPSLRDFGKGAKVGLLLNDWACKCGGDSDDEAEYAVRELRHAGVPFSIIPDDFATAQELAGCDLLIAPGADFGFGRNARGEEIGPILMDWVRRGGRLVVSRCAPFEKLLGLKRSGSPRRGRDMSLYVDVGAPRDDTFIVSGVSSAEDWAELPEGSFGRTEHKSTFRWAPGRGDRTRLLLPVSPNRDHVLRFGGKAVWSNTVDVFVEGTQVATMEIVDKPASYDVFIPAAAIGSRRAAHIDLVWEKKYVPADVDPERFPDEKRVCNLGLEWVQISTADREFSENRLGVSRPSVPLDSPVFGPLRGKVLRTGMRLGEPLEADGWTVFSRYREDGSPQSLVVAAGKGRALYVDTPLGEMGPGFVQVLLERWAGQKGEAPVRGREVAGALLRAGSTRLLMAYNYDIRARRKASFSLDVGDEPVAEVVALSVDGRQYEPVRFRRQRGRLTFEDALRYYGVYEVALSPVKVQTGEMALCVGETSAFPVELRNLGKQAATGTVSLASTIPTLSAADVPFALQPGERARLMLSVSARQDIDPGRKTVALRIETGGESDAYFWRQILVQRPPQVRVSAGLLKRDRVRLAVKNEQAPGEPTACARGVTLEVQGREVRIGDIGAGRTVERAVPLRMSVAEPGLSDAEIGVERSASEGCPPTVTRQNVTLAACPRSVAGPADARAAICVFRTGDSRSQPAPVVVHGLDVEWSGRLRLFTQNGEQVPCQRTADGGICFAAPAGSEAVATYFLRESAGKRLGSDLEARSVNLGTGRGAIEASNEYLSLRFRELRGAVCTRLALNATGDQYAADCFGVAYGRFSRYDPLHPAHSADQFIQESKTEQSKSPGRLSLVERGPVRAVWEATWEDENVQAAQRYELWAGMPWLKVTSSVRPKRRLSAQELVALDLRLRREPFSKIYPGFSGQQLDGEKPHFGWRQVPYVHEIGSMLAPPDFEHSLSLIVASQKGLDGWRQGFWPRARPEPGPCKYARIELLREKPGSGGASVECYVLAHDGNQERARRFLEVMKQPPTAVVIPVRRQPPA